MDKITMYLRDVLAVKKDKQAIWDNEGSFTYSELMNYAFKISARLKKNGLSFGDCVTIELPERKEYIGVMLGVWFCGGVYAALDCSYPQERLDFIAKDCGAKIRITREFLNDLENEQLDMTFADNRPDDPSVIIYTSGSTGNPKGVLHTRRSIAESAERMKTASEFCDDDRYALTAPFTFVAATQGIFGCLISGASAFLTPAEARRDPVKLADFIDEYKITQTFISPKMLKLSGKRVNPFGLCLPAVKESVIYGAANFGVWWSMVLRSRQEAYCVFIRNTNMTIPRSENP